jgi:hypothetical protein
MKFETLARTGKLAGIDFNKDAEASRAWFRERAYSVKYASTKQFQKNATAFQNIERLSANSIGKLYFFSYDPKHKLTLKYYDIFPLVFPIEFYSDGFLGINLHYLPPFMRAKLMDALYQTLNNKKHDNTTKLMISYQILKAAGQFKLFQPCVHRYLFSHVKSAFQYIPPVAWDYTILLPLNRFQKKSAEFVWATSLLSV